MKLNYYGYHKANCKHCGKIICEMYDGGWKTRTEITQSLIAEIRYTGGAVTADGRAYCKDCKEKLQIRKGRK